MSQTDAHATGEQPLRSRVTFEEYRQQYLIGAALLLAVAAHSGDVATTAIGLSAGLTEWHPVSAYFFERLGFAVWNTISITIMIGWAALSREIGRRFWPAAADHTPIAVLTSFALYKMLIVGWNVRALWAAGAI